MSRELSSPAGFSTPAIVEETTDRKRVGFQLRSAALRIACGDQQHVRSGGLQRDDLTVDGRLGHFVGRRPDDHALMLGAKSVREALEVAAPEIVVLIEDRHLRLRLRLQRVMGVEGGLGGVNLEERHCPGIMFGVDDAEA